MALADAVSFIAAAAGSGSFTHGAARASFLTLTQAVTIGELVDGQTVAYLAQDSLSSPTQREWGHGTFHSAGNGSIARTVVLGTVSATGASSANSPLSFTVAPTVSLTALASDFVTGINSVNVSAFGAKGDGVTDDTSAIQSAINSLGSNGGTVVFNDNKTYLLNSFTTAAKDATFHYNLSVPSNITLMAFEKSTLKQGSSGRVANQISPILLLSSTSTYPLNSWQTASLNGGFFTINATKIADNTITLSNPSQASNFNVNDFIYVVSNTVGDVIASEPNQILSISGGVLGLRWPQTRAYSSPSVADINSIAFQNITLRNLTLIGQNTVDFRGFFNWQCYNVDFITDLNLASTTIPDFQFETARGVLWDQCTVRTTNGNPATFLNMQILQRNSLDVTIRNSSFYIAGIGAGENLAHWKILNNFFYLYTTDPTGSEPALHFSGQDVLFEGNTVYGGILANTGAIIVDWDTSVGYKPFVGEVRIIGNNFSVQDTSNNGNIIEVQIQDTVVSNNIINVSSGNGVGIFCINTNTITGNYIKTGSAFVGVLDCVGILVICGSLAGGSDVDGGVIANNTIVGTAAGNPANYFGIFIKDTGLASPATGSLNIGPNTITGFTTNYSFTLSNHPNSTFIDGGKVTMGGPVINGPLTFSSLPVSPSTGTVAYIKDGKAANCGDGTCTTFGTTVTAGGGALNLLIWFDGTNWTLIGK